MLRPNYAIVGRHVGMSRRCCHLVKCCRSSFQTIRHSSDTSHAKINVEALLSKPQWDVNHLLPSPSTQHSSAQDVTVDKLHHLLRLSALPPPKDKFEQDRMLGDLSAQLHFVREIQKVDTDGVPPLKSLRDETRVGENEATVDLERLRDAFASETVEGSYYKRIRRRQNGDAEASGAIKWDPLALPKEKVGRYFVVDSARKT